MFLIKSNQQAVQGFPLNRSYTKAEADARFAQEVSIFTNGSIPFAGPDGRLTQNNSNFSWDDTNDYLKLGNGTSTTSVGTNLALQTVKNAGNTYFIGVNAQNTNAGTTASTDYVLNADNATDTTNYLDFGINSSGNADASYTLFAAGDGYIYNQTQDLNIGTASAQALKFFTGGTLTANERMRITSTGLVGIGISAPTQKLHIYTNSANGAIKDQLRIDGGTQSATNAGSGQIISFVANATYGAVGGYGNGTLAGMAIWANAVSGTPKVVINTTGMGIGETAPGAMLQITSSAAGTIGEIIKGASSQTADLTQWQNSSGTVMSRIYYDGTYNFVGTTTQSAANFISGSINPASTGIGYYMNGTFGNNAANSYGFRSTPTVAASTALVSYAGYFATNPTLNSGAAITTLYGVQINDQTVGSTNIGIGLAVSSGSNKYNVYASGTAQNYFAGSVGINSTAPLLKLEVGYNNTGTLGDNVIGINFPTGNNRGTRLAYDDTAGTVYGAYFMANADETRNTATLTARYTNSQTIRLGLNSADASSGIGFYTDTGLTAGNTFTPTQRMIINNSGNVGIGVTPTYRLDVAYTYTSADGGLDTIFRVAGTDQAISGNSTHYAITEDLTTGNPNISAGVTDSGYRVGLRAAAKANNASLAGTLTSQYGIWAQTGIQVATSGAVVTNTYGVYSDLQLGAASTTITNGYLFRGDYNGSSTTVTNKYGIYMNGESKNYLTGSLGIGQTSPTAYLHLKAGTTAASTAPIKLTSGSLMTAAEAGAIEFLTDDYYGTVTTNTVRRKFVMDTTGRATAQTAANASVQTHTNGSTDATFEVSANVLVTTSSAENFTVTVAYTDEGNTARTLTLPFSTLAGTMVAAINFANGAIPYAGAALHIRVKASTTITIATTGTFTGATYNVEGIIKRL